MFSSYHVFSKPFFWQDFGVKYWLSHGMQKEKLILGMPLYGESFTLVNGTDYTYGAKVVGPGKPGEFTQVGGFLAYYEVIFCKC